MPGKNILFLKISKEKLSSSLSLTKYSIFSNSCPLNCYSLLEWMSGKISSMEIFTVLWIFLKPGVILRKLLECGQRMLKKINGCNPLSMRKKIFFLQYDKNFRDANISLLLQRALPTSVGSFLTPPSNINCTSQAYHVPSSWNIHPDAFLHLYLLDHQDRDERLLSLRSLSWFPQH